MKTAMTVGYWEEKSNEKGDDDCRLLEMTNAYKKNKFQ